MIKIIKYFLQSIFIYLFFLLGLILGLKISRKIFSYIFNFIGPILKSKKTIEKNLNIFSKIFQNLKRKNYKLNVEKLRYDIY